MLKRPDAALKTLGPFLVVAGMALATPALADPCKAVPDAGPLPGYLSSGAEFSGPVTYVGDGDSLCVGVRAGPAGWVEVRLADFYAPEMSEAGGAEAKAVLQRLTQGRRITCVAERRSYDRVVARCLLNGLPLGDRLRAAGIPEGGRGR
jgi:micrococcal nuclease